MAFKNSTTAPLLGRIVKKTFSNGLPSGCTLTTTGLTTTSFADGVMRVSGGTGNFTDYSENIKIDRYLYGDKFEHLCVFKPIVAGSGFTLQRNELSDTAASNWIRVELTNDASKGKISFGYNNNVSIVGTTQLIDFTYNNELMYVRETYDKQVGGQYIEIGIYKENGTFKSYLKAPTDRNKCWNSRICFVGGTIDFYELSVNLRVLRNPRILGIGDSNMFCYDGSGVQAREWDYGYMYNLRRRTNTTIENLAFAGATILNHTAYLDLILEINPEYVLLNDGTNDMLLGSNLATYQPKYLAFCNTLLNAGIKIIHFGSFPGQPATVLSQYVAWNAWKLSLANGTTQFYVDLYTELKDPLSDTLNPIYWGQGGIDGTHLSYLYQYIASDALAIKLKPFINI